MRAQQHAFDAFRHEYNDERPHEALAYATRASLYQPSCRPYPSRLPEPDYPPHFHLERAYPNGVISFQGIQWYLRPCVAGQLLGLTEVDDDRWAVYFGPIELGTLGGRRAQVRGYRQSGVLVRTDGEITSRRRGRRR